MRMRIRIQQLKLMRINADPDPKPCILKASLFLSRGQKGTMSRIRNTAVQKKIPELEIRLWTQSYGSGIRYLFDPEIRGKNSRS